MFASKLNISLLLTLQCLFMSACGISSSTNAADVKIPQKTLNTICDIDGYDPITKSNNIYKMEKELAYHINTLSGAASALKEIVHPKEVYEKSQSLAAICETDFSTLEIDCDGKIKVEKDQKTQELTYDQLISMRLIYVKNVHICNSLELKQEDSLHIVAAHMTLQNLTIKQSQGSVLSLSAEELLGGTQGLKQLIQEPGSAIMIHAYSLK